MWWHYDSFRDRLCRRCELWRSCSPYWSHGIQCCVPSDTRLSSEESSLALGMSRKYPTQVCPERKSSSQEERVRGKRSESEMTSFFQKAGRGLSEKIMDPNWQENFSKYRAICAFACFSSEFSLIWGRGCAIQNSTFYQSQYFWVKLLQLLAVLPMLDDSHHGGVKDVTARMLLKIPVCSEEWCYILTITNVVMINYSRDSGVNICKQFGFPLTHIYAAAFAPTLSSVIPRLEQLVSCKFCV